MADTEMTRRSILFGTVASLIRTPAVVRAASLMPIRGLPSQLLNPERKIPATVEEWYQLCFYNNLDNDLRAGRGMTYGPIGGEKISKGKGHRIVSRARAEGWLPPYDQLEVRTVRLRASPDATKLATLSALTLFLSLASWPIKF